MKTRNKSLFRFNHLHTLNRVKILQYVIQISVTDISFDKAVGHLFIDSMSLLTHEAPPWLAWSGEIFRI